MALLIPTLSVYEKQLRSNRVSTEITKKLFGLQSQTVSKSCQVTSTAAADHACIKIHFYPDSQLVFLDAFNPNRSSKTRDACNFISWCKARLNFLEIKVRQRPLKNVKKLDTRQFANENICRISDVKLSLWLLPFSQKSKPVTCWGWERLRHQSW